MKILITGGTGFIGTNLTAELRSRGHEVFTADLRHTPETKRTHFRCDIGEYRHLERIFEQQKFDFVFNLAAEYGRWNGEAYYDLLWKTNCVGMKNILVLQKKYKFKLTTFSSAEVYGDYRDLMTEDVMDKIPIKQMNDYAISKWANELQCLNAAAMWGNEIVRIRPVNCYGPHEEYSPYRGVIPILVYHGMFNLPATVYNGHKRIFDYVSDTVRTVANTTENFKPGEVYNIAAKKEVDIKYVSDLIIRELGIDDSHITYSEGEPFTTKQKPIDCSKAYRDLNHRIDVPIEKGIPLYIEWMKKRYPDYIKYIKMK
ncbi:MAG: NAD(P)-dependent oxidoreductase [Candidatus Lokiarchaeota archaeon]|nr:NAD(P)-dependent oxidoreductase [Candidatus Harpocratesius repetitus]